MLGYRVLQQLLALGGPIRRANVEDGSAIIKAIVRITDPELLRFADDDLRERLVAPVLQVGLSPGDMEIDGRRFSALADVRCQGMLEMLSVSFEGTLDDGYASLERAWLNGSQAVLPAKLTHAARR